MRLSSTTLFTLLASVSLVSATGFHQKFSWGCDKDTRDRAPHDVKNDCSGRGSFFTSKGGSAVCCSDKTRSPPPKDDDCPWNWSWNKKSGCCIPPKEVCERDCGEGYVFNKNKLKCERKEINKCGKGKWWHDRNKECCDFDWGWDKGDCPKGKKCPKHWHWSKKAKRCKPDTPRAPEPDCDDWNEHGGCCGGGHQEPTGHYGHGPKPPHPGKPEHPGKPGHPGKPNHPGKPDDHPKGPSKGNDNHGPGHNGGGGRHKRNVYLRRSTQVLFPQTETDKMYCPGSLHACSINTVLGGEWAYECIDFATELESCGGCASTGDGQDCTKIPNAMSVGCEKGSCAVYTCQPGFQANGTACALT